MKLKLPSVFSRRQQFTPVTQEKINAQKEKTKIKRTATAKAKKASAEKNIPDSDVQSTTRSVKLSARIAIGWSNFRNKCSINWKKLCMNYFSSESEKNKLQEEIKTLEGEIKSRNNVYKAKENFKDAKTALENDDPLGMAKATVQGVKHATKALFHNPNILTKY